MSRVLQLVDTGEDHRLILEPQELELTYRAKQSFDLKVKGIDVARLVAHSDRGVHRRASGDVIRSLIDLNSMLRKGDVVVTNRGNPAAVVVPVEEYERLTGRRVK